METYETLDYVPEFSIGVFDAYDPTTHAFTRPRPLRLASLFIFDTSTQGAGLTQDEQDYLEAGKERTCTFGLLPVALWNKGFLKVISRNSNSSCASQCLDTVALPIDVPMYYLGTDTDFGRQDLGHTDDL